MTITPAPRDATRWGGVSCVDRRAQSCEDVRRDVITYTISNGLQGEGHCLHRSSLTT